MWVEEGEWKEVQMASRIPSLLYLHKIMYISFCIWGELAKFFFLQVLNSVFKTTQINQLKSFEYLE